MRRRQQQGQPCNPFMKPRVYLDPAAARQRCVQKADQSEEGHERPHLPHPITPSGTSLDKSCCPVVEWECVVCNPICMPSFQDTQVMLPLALCLAFGLLLSERLRLHSGSHARSTDTSSIDSSPKRQNPGIQRRTFACRSDHLIRSTAPFHTKSIFYTPVPDLIN